MSEFDDPWNSKTREAVERGQNFTPTDEEAKAIRSLERLAKRWPDSLWLFSASGALHVMRAGEDGEHVHLKQGIGVDPDYILATIDISNDGGDW